MLIFYSRLGTKAILFFVLTASLISCVGRSSVVAEEDLAPMSEQDLFVFDLESNFKSQPQSTMLNELTDSISYIPLETTKDALFPNYYYQFAKTGSDYYISGGAANRASPVFRFDSSGRFVRQVTYHGRGPNEVTAPSEWYYNKNLAQINIISSGSHMVVLRIADDERFTVEIDSSMGSSRVPLNDSTYVSSRSIFVTSIHKAHIYFTDNGGNLVHSIERSDDKAEYKAVIREGEDNGPWERYWLAPHYDGDAIFHDIFNDTLYRIKSRTEITPHLVFKRGALSPDPKDVAKQESKKKQIHFTHVEESGGYVFLNYYYGGKLWRDVWSKRDGSLLIHTAPEKFGSIADIFIPFALPDGSVIELPIVFVEKEHVYGIMEALDACRFLPGVKETDNPVIVIAKLKE